MKYQRKPIEGFPGYEIDTDGNVYSYWKMKPEQDTKNGKILKTISYLSNNASRLKCHKTNKGYLYFNLRENNRKTVKKVVHRLLATAFIPNPTKKPYVCHKNDIKTDNRIENLYWGDNSDNQKDAIKNGGRIITKGEDCSWSKLTADDVVNIRKLYDGNRVSQANIAKKFKLNQSTVWEIINNKIWKHVS